MTLENIILESHWGFRLIKVIYYFLFIISLFVSLFIGACAPSFKEGVSYFSIALFCFYFLINVFRETLIYIFFGRKFTWQWAHDLFQKKNNQH